MSLSKLPAECRDQIFDEAVLVRTFRRAMRLRTVNRQFRDGIIRAIYRTRFLERLVNSGMLVLGPLDEQRSPEWTSLLYSYFAQRICRGPDVPCHKSRFRLVVERICELRGDTENATLETCIHNLCPLIFFRSSNSNIVQWIQSMPESELSDGQFERYLVDATVYLDLIELTSTLLEAQADPNSGTSEFSAFILRTRLEIAAYKGSLGMIRILLATESTFKKDGYILPHLSARILECAARRGHKDICNFALDKREPSGSSDRDNDPHCHSTWAIQFSELDELELAVSEPSLSDLQGYRGKGDDDLNFKLCESARRGNFQMVRYLLDRGACLNSPRTKRGVASLDRAGNLIDDAGMQPFAATPVHAALNNHIRNESIVKMLLEHGVDPNWSLPEFSPLKKAVEINWPSVVRMLIDYGANINEGNPPPIVVAVEKEDMEMFRFLRQKGAVLNTPETGSRAMAVAKHRGLVSMVAVLADAGVEEVSTTKELEIKREFHRSTLSYYMTTEMGKIGGTYGEYRGQWSITKALENGNGFKPWPHKKGPVGT